MATFALSFKSILGVIILNKRDPIRLLWVLCWKEMEKGVGITSFMPLLDDLEGEK